MNDVVIDILVESLNHWPMIVSITLFLTSLMAFSMWRLSAEDAKLEIEVLEMYKMYPQILAELNSLHLLMGGHGRNYRMAVNLIGRVRSQYYHKER